MSALGQLVVRVVEAARCRLGRCRQCSRHETEDGIGGRCDRCGHIHGFMTRAELRALAPGWS